MAGRNFTGLKGHSLALAKLVQENARRHRVHEVWSDFCEIAALSISNAVDRHQFDKREARYFDILKRYEPAEMNTFAAMLGELVRALEEGMSDVLGQVFMALELGDHWKGQFFTPYHVAMLMASVSLTDAKAIVEREGFITLSEPACGAGAMVIASAQALHEQGINYQQRLHVFARDLDRTAAHMAYVQLALLHIPAIVVQGNSLSGTCIDYWVTPAHVLGMWDFRLRRRAQASADLGDVEAVAEQAEAPQACEGQAMPPAADEREAAASATVQPSPVQLHELREKIVAEQMSLFG
jgi:hypothetical protein